MTIATHRIATHLFSPHSAARAAWRACWIAVVFLVYAFPAEAQRATITEVTFEASDGITIFGDLYEAEAPRTAPLILLFHQGGGDARGEYGPLVDRLTAQGYHALAIDQRQGGGRLGGENRTVALLEEDVFTYCEAYADLEAALAFVKAAGFTGRRIAWGSSYSAALVFKLAAGHDDDFAAVLAFSPASGEPMAGCEPEAYSALLSVPVLVLRPTGEMEIDRVRIQRDGFQAQGHQTYVADPGVHGSSMLNPERVGADTEAAWAVVLDFIARALAP